jgi:acetyl esterase/lipase
MKKVFIAIVFLFGKLLLATPLMDHLPIALPKIDDLNQVYAKTKDNVSIVGGNFDLTHNHMFFSYNYLKDKPFVTLTSPIAGTDLEHYSQKIVRLLDTENFKSWFDVNDIFHKNITWADEIYYTDTQQPMYFFKPKGLNIHYKKPIFVFFSGGGWQHSSPTQMSKYAYFLKELGYLSVVVDYRTIDIDKQERPDNAIEDVLNSIDILKNRNPIVNNGLKVIAGGVSAGGHLSAYALLVNTDEKSRPDGLILMNPVIDLSVTGWEWAHNYLGKRWREYSPAHHINKNFRLKGYKKRAPILIITGDKDRIADLNNMIKFKRSYYGRGGCDLYFFERRGHTVKDYRWKDMFLINLFIEKKFLVPDK